MSPSIFHGPIAFTQVCPYSSDYTDTGDVEVQSLSKHKEEKEKKHRLDDKHNEELNILLVLVSSASLVSPHALT